MRYWLVMLTIAVSYYHPALAADNTPANKRASGTDSAARPEKSQSAESKESSAIKDIPSAIGEITEGTPKQKPKQNEEPKKAAQETAEEAPKEQPKEPSAKPGKRVVLDRLEASVNSSMILLSDIRKFREILRLRAQLDPLFAGTPVAAKGPSASNTDIVEFLINERLITQQYPKSDSEVEQEINSIQANNHLTRAALKEALGREGYKFPDYFELIRDSSSKRDLIDRDIRTKVSISDDDVKNYFYNHVTKGTVAPRAYHIEIISVSLASYKTPSAANKVAADALKSIQTGEPFEEVARRVSDDSSAPSGGDLGVLTEDQMAPMMRDQVKNLQIGKVTGIFGGPGPTGKGAKAQGRYYILKLVDIKSSETDRYDKMKEEIRGQLAASEYQHQISLWIDRQRQSAFIHREGEPSVKEVPVAR